MGEPFPDVWLPQAVDMRAALLFAFGEVSVRYRIDYHDYREARTDGRVIPVTP